MVSWNSDKILRVLSTVLSLVLVVFIMSFATTPFMPKDRFGILFYMLAMVISILSLAIERPLFRDKNRLNLLITAIMSIASIVAGIYFFHEFHALWDRAGSNTLVDLVLGGIVVYLSLHLTWLTSGKAIPFVVLAFFAFGFAGSWLPGALYHRSFSLSRMIQVSCLDMSGVYGNFTQLVGTWIAIFVIFAGAIQGYGGLNYIVNVSRAVTRKLTYGAPQMAVTASMAFGSFSGSAAANAAGTGAITIPFMKKYGIPPHIAAAIEAVASTGGVIMPPVMGTTIFLMCELLSRPYVEMIARCLAPAIIFYLIVMISVYLLSKKFMNPDAPVFDDEKEHLSIAYLLQGLPIFLALVFFLCLLIILKIGIFLSGFYLVVSFLFMRLIYDIALSKGRSLPGVIKQFLISLVNGMRGGMRTLAMLATMIACMGVVVEILVGSGLAQTLSWLMVDIAHGKLFVLLFMIMIISLLFGIAVATPIAYLLVVLLAAPALEQLGVEIIVSHFVIVYLAILSAITPPVAVASGVTSNIAGAKFFRTCWESIKLGLPLFILPFIFITHPDLVSGDLNALIPAVRSIAGLLAIAFAIHSSWNEKSGTMMRVALGLCGLLILFASTIISNVMLILLFISAGIAYARYKRQEQKNFSSTGLRNARLKGKDYR